MSSTLLDRLLYPPIEPYAAGELDVGDGHRLYWERCGSRGGLPAVFLHGGPGAGCTPEARRLFDPGRYDVLLFDQRGAGRSRPHAGLTANTTWHLVDDIERLRQLAGAERWLLFGGSWGSTLAMAYAQRHPQRVSAMVLRGVFTGRKAEIDWYYRDGASWVFPEAWNDLVTYLPPDERGEVVAAYHRRLTGPNPCVRRAAAEQWSRWEARTVRLLQTDQALLDAYEDPDFAVALARIETHYLMNDLWLEEGRLLREAAKLAGIPGTIVQGRYDACTPPRTAWELHRAWPGSELVISPEAGHRFDEPGILGSLRAATDRLAASLCEER
jgi:proline iminopeptidase